MKRTSSRAAFGFLVGLCLVAAVVGLFFRSDHGPEALPLLYPMLGVLVVVVPVLAVRPLSRLLAVRGEENNAD